MLQSGDLHQIWPALQRRSRPDLESSKQTRNDVLLLNLPALSTSPMDFKTWVWIYSEYHLNGNHDPAESSRPVLGSARENKAAPFNTAALLLCWRLPWAPECLRLAERESLIFHSNISDEAGTGDCWNSAPVGAASQQLSTPETVVTVVDDWGLIF